VILVFRRKIVEYKTIFIFKDICNFMCILCRRIRSYWVYICLCKRQSYTIVILAVMVWSGFSRFKDF
jgi:hypothetical protein